MKVALIQNGKVAAVSHTDTRPSDPSWHIVDENLNIRIGDTLSAKGEIVTDYKADVKNAVLLHKQARERHEALKAQHSSAKLAYEDSQRIYAIDKEKFDRSCTAMNAAYEKMFEISGVVEESRSLLLIRKREMDDLVSAEIEVEARKAADDAFQKKLEEGMRRIEEGLPDTKEASGIRKDGKAPANATEMPSDATERLSATAVSALKYDELVKYAVSLGLEAKAGVKKEDLLAAIAGLEE